MALFPQSFIEDLRHQADIVRVVQDYVSLKKSGASYKGLCPFHSEKTPSFTVNQEKGFFYCFGCGVGGDVFKFLELQEKLAFPDAVRHLAQKLGLQVPDAEPGREGDAAEREALLKVHERATAHFRAQLAADGGKSARQYLSARGLTDQTVEELALGFAPRSRSALREALVEEGFDPALLLRSGLVLERDQEQIDRFRQRLVVPICRDTGPVVAFGARALDTDQQPKYLNSPETPIYSKGRTLYGLNLTKAHIRRLGYVVLVEGYFDFAQLWQAGIHPVAATCGTALTVQQAQLLRRSTSRVILSFDPDAAGQGAAARSCDLLVAEGFEVNVVLLPAGEDPDGLVRQRGRDGYLALLRTSRPYLDFLMDQAAGRHDLAGEEGRRQFLREMLGVAARIPDAAARDQFADRLSHRARITEDVIRDEIRKAAGARRTDVTGTELPAGPVRQHEKGLLWALVHEPDKGLEALEELAEQDLEGLHAASILRMARSLRENGAEAFPGALFERLNSREAQILSAAAAEPQAPSPPDGCVRALTLLRFERERAGIQEEIDRLQRLGGEAQGRIDELWQRKMDLVHRIEGLA